MSAPDLPDDLQRWPKDPYQLLGVTPAIDPRQLRKIYTRLIRTYKPEQFPEHFRLIREAYESVLHYVEFFQSLHGSRDAAEEQAEEPRSDEAEPAAQPPEQLNIFPRLVSTVASLDEELDRLWQRACSGEEKIVYRRLAELHDQKPGQVDLCLRLYWLLALTPELDSQRSPCDWLIQGLVANGFSGPLRELYRREVADDPAEALSQRYHRLLRLPLGPGQLADLAESRWQAACRVGNWKVIDDDLESLYDRLAKEEDETWVRLLISAAEQLAALDGHGPRQLSQECMKQITHFDHFQGRLADSLDRLEFYLKVSAGLRCCRRSFAASEEFLQLIAWSWTRPFGEVRPLLWRHLEQLAGNPRAALQIFDKVHRQGAAVLTQFGNVLAMLQGSLPDGPAETRSRNALVQLIADFADSQGRQATETELRPLLLEFCLREAIAPELVAEVFANGPWGHKLATDWPLRYVYMGCRLFWLG